MLSREDRLLNSLRSRPQMQAPVGTDLFLPNHSGFAKELNAGNINIQNNATSSIVLRATNGTGYKQTFRVIEGSRLEWLWGNATTEDLYFSILLSGGQNRIRTNARDFNIFGAAGTDATPLLIIKASDASGDTTVKGTLKANNLQHVINGTTYSIRQHIWDFTILNPNGAQTTDNEIFIAFTKEAITITKIQIELDAAANEIDANLMYADSFLGQENSATINDLNTTSGKRTDTTIASATVAAGKAVYISFDAAPNVAIKQMYVHIEWSYN